MLKFISWNVNGIRACCDKGFRDIFNELDADFFCLQETKMQEGQLDLQFEGYQSYWNYAEKKGYSGTAIFTRHQPLSVTYGIGVEEHDHEGRVVTLEMDKFYLVTVYVPNSQDELRRLDYRMTWEDAFLAYVKQLDAKKPVVFRKAIVGMQVLRMRNVPSSVIYFLKDLQIHSDISIPNKRKFILGGRIALRPGKRTQAGGLITL